MIVAVDLEAVGLDTLQVAEPLLGVLAGLGWRHPAIHVFLSSHLYMKTKLILDTSLRCRAEEKSNQSIDFIFNAEHVVPQTVCITLVIASVSRCQPESSVVSCFLPRAVSL